MERDKIERLIISTLTNNEVSTDEELIDYFVSEVDITKEEAEHWIAKRNEYLNEF